MSGWFITLLITGMFLGPFSIFQLNILTNHDSVSKFGLHNIVEQSHTHAHGDDHDHDSEGDHNTEGDHEHHHRHIYVSVCNCLPVLKQEEIDCTHKFTVKDLAFHFEDPTFGHYPLQILRPPITSLA